jgi:hypothetical protein
VWGGAGLAGGQQHEDHRPDGHRQAEEPHRGELDRARLVLAPTRRDVARRRRRGGEESTSKPTNLRRRDEDELRTERAWERVRDESGVQGRSIVRFARTEVITRSGELQGSRQKILPLYLSISAASSTFVTTQVP